MYHLRLFAASIALVSHSLSGAELPRLEATEFAPRAMVGSVVALSFDAAGRAYVTQTQRRTHAALDIRRHMDWLGQTLRAQSIEDKRRMIRARFDEGSVGDANADGKVDWHDLKVPTELILALEDTDGDGRADRKEIFAGGFNTEITGLAGGVLAHQGKVYTTIIPSLWRLRDTDGDLQADRRKEIVTGFGIHVGYGGHDMHGLTVGPDGMIYWSIGDKALSVTSKEGRHYHLPYHGAILRCLPDGSHFEVYAKGLRNPQELAFDQHGNLFVVDNDGDFGDRERVHFILEGSDSGWRAFYQYRNDERLGDLSGYNAWIAENLWRPHFPGQSAAITPCLANFSEGPAGFTYNPGSALSQSLAGHFFLTEFPGKRLQAFRLQPEGAGFRMAEPRVIFSGEMLVGINFGPDGALYAADWGPNEWLPHGDGRVLRLDVPQAHRHPLRRKTAALLREGVRHLPEGRLLDLLGYPDQRVRLAAQFEIVRRGDFAILRQTAVADSRNIARIHGIWGCAQLVRTRKGETLQGLVSLIGHRDPEVRGQIFKAFGETQSAFAINLVRRGLFDPHPRGRLAAALAMHHLAGPADIEIITHYIAVNGGEDVFQRHGGVRALTGAARGRPDLLVALHDHHFAVVRLAAVVALRRLHETAEESKTLEDADEFAGLAKFLQDEDETILTETARAIHDVVQPSPVALSALASMLETTKLDRDPLIRRVINANRLLGDERAAARLLAFGVRSSTPRQLRQEALASAATWTRLLPFDRVLGLARTAPAAPPEWIHRALGEQLEHLLRQRQQHEALIDLISHTRYQPGIEALMHLANDPDGALRIRERALEAALALDVPGAGQRMRAAAASSHSALRQVAHRYLAKHAANDPGTVEMLGRALSSQNLGEAQQAYRLLGQLKAHEVLRQEAEAIGQRKPEVRLDLLEAVQTSGDGEALASLALYQAAKAPDDPLAKYRESLAGGDPHLGREILLNHVLAQCIRCHQIDGRGGEIGPELKDVAKRLSPEKLLASLVLPQEDIPEGYGLISLTLGDGNVVAGTLVRETAHLIEIRDAAGHVQKVEAASVTARTPAMSAMPPMGDLLSKRELRDLMAHLMTLK